MRPIWLFMGLLLVACAGETAVAPAAKADAITCHAAYRPDVGRAIEREESVTFSDQNAEQAIPFTDLVFHAAYYSGELDNERSLRVWVTDAVEGVMYHSQLYQLQQESGPQDQFVGGHGFTGLGYTYHPATGAELQHWCTAGAAP